LRRLELRIGYPPEEPDPGSVSLKILIDGQELLTRAGPRGAYIGPWPGAVLTDDSPLLPASPPRRVLLYSEGADDPDESTVTAVISTARDQVTWTDFRECRAAAARDGDRMVFGLRPPGSTELSVPDIVFDREQYLAEVRRAIAAREWESDRWQTATLLNEYLGQAIWNRPDLSDDDFYPSCAEPADGDSSRFLVSLWDDLVPRHGIVIAVITGSGTPQQRARAMTDAIMATPGDQWRIVRRMERSE
jgi:hypothetical protein